MLNEQQQSAQEQILAFLQSSANEIILQGFAGTGKSYLINSIKDSYEQMVELGLAEPKGWVFLATTHKACEILRAQGLKAQTVHSFYAINIMDKPTGKMVHIPNNTVIVIDECSYLNYDVLHVIQSYISSNIKIIYVGDRNQLTPVGLNHCPVYYQDIPMVILTHAVRQQNTPCIAEYCSQLRNAVENSLDTPPIPLTNNIIKLSESDFKDKTKDIFNHSQYKRLLALKNTTVQKFNKHICPRDIEVGDWLVNNSATKYLPNNAYVQVVHIEGIETIMGVNCICYTVEYYGNDYHIYVPLSATGLSRARNKAKQTGTWDLYHSMADLRLPYAQTIHKAQGSTYKEVFIYLDDLKQCETKKERNRLLYVAFSRATDRVYITGDFQ